MRGTTLNKLVSLFRSAGAREVHVRVAAPATTGSCYYGIDTPTSEELIASSKTPEEIRAHIDADTLAYLSLEALREIEASMKHGFCDACFSGDYVISPETLAKDDRQLPLFEGDE